MKFNLGTVIFGSLTLLAADTALASFDALDGMMEHRHFRNAGIPLPLDLTQGGDVPLDAIRREWGMYALVNTVVTPVAGYFTWRIMR